MGKDTAETIVVTIVPFHVLATMFMSLRLYSKRLSKANYSPDDYVLMVAWVSILPTSRPVSGMSLRL